MSMKFPDNSNASKIIDNTAGYNTPDTNNSKHKKDEKDVEIINESQKNLNLNKKSGMSCPCDKTYKSQCEICAKQASKCKQDSNSLIEHIIKISDTSVQSNEYPTSLVDDINEIKKNSTSSDKYDIFVLKEDGKMRGYEVNQYMFDEKEEEDREAILNKQIQESLQQGRSSSDRTKLYKERIKSILYNLKNKSVSAKTKESNPIILEITEISSTHKQTSVIPSVSVQKCSCEAKKCKCAQRSSQTTQSVCSLNGNITNINSRVQMYLSSDSSEEYPFTVECGPDVNEIPCDSSEHNSVTFDRLNEMMDDSTLLKNCPKINTTSEKEEINGSNVTNSKSQLSDKNIDDTSSFSMNTSSFIGLLVEDDKKDSKQETLDNKNVDAKSKRSVCTETNENMLRAEVMGIEKKSDAKNDTLTSNKKDCSIDLNSDKLCTKENSNSLLFKTRTENKNESLPYKSVKLQSTDSQSLQNEKIENDSKSLQSSKNNTKNSILSSKEISLKNKTSNDDSIKNEAANDKLDFIQKSVLNEAERYKIVKSLLQEIQGDVINPDIQCSTANAEELTRTLCKKQGSKSCTLTDKDCTKISEIISCMSENKEAHARTNKTITSICNNESESETDDVANESKNAISITENSENKTNELTKSQKRSEMETAIDKSKIEEIENLINAKSQRDTANQTTLQKSQAPENVITDEMSQASKTETSKLQTNDGTTLQKNKQFSAEINEKTENTQFEDLKAKESIPTEIKSESIKTPNNSKVIENKTLKEGNSSSVRKEAETVCAINSSSKQSTNSVNTVDIEISVAEDRKDVSKQMSNLSQTEISKKSPATKLEIELALTANMLEQTKEEYSQSMITFVENNQENYTQTLKNVRKNKVGELVKYFEELDKKKSEFK